MKIPPLLKPEILPGIAHFKFPTIFQTCHGKAEQFRQQSKKKIPPVPTKFFYIVELQISTTNEDFSWLKFYSYLRKKMKKNLNFIANVSHKIYEKRALNIILLNPFANLFSELLQ